MTRRGTDNAALIFSEGEQLAEFAVGIVVVLFAIGLIQHHREKFRAGIAAGGAEIAHQEREFLNSRKRRRLIAGSLILLVGALFVADSLIEDVLASVVMIIVVLSLMPVMFVLAVIDFYYSQQHLRPQLQSTSDAKRALIEEADRLAELQATRESNASAGDPGRSREAPDAESQAE